MLFLRLPLALLPLAAGCIWVTQERYDDRLAELTDADGDGFVSADWDGDDCDDQDSAVNPEAEEACDGVDNDCDGIVDEDDAVDAGTWYQDDDSDGYGDPDSTTTACEQPSGYVDGEGDCDDLDPSVNPAADEVCNGSDDDCDDLVDEEDPDLTGASSWYEDADGDGFGDPESASTGCSQPSDWVEDSSDCDDGDAEVNPEAQEICDEVDNDCDDRVDDEDDDVSGAQVWCEDADGDGYGDDDSTTEACSQPSGWVEAGADCDDGDQAVYPGRLEHLANGVDDDCDGVEDELSAIEAYDSDGVAGPRLAVSEDMLVLAWAAESCEDDDGGELFEARLGLIFDPSEEGSPLVETWIDGDSSSTGSMAAQVDFVLMDEYWAWATLVDSGSQQIRVDVVDSSSGSTGRLTSTVGASAELEQVQLSGDEDSGMLTAVGCVSATGTNLFQASQSASSIVSGSGGASSYTGSHYYGGSYSQSSFSCAHDPASGYLYVGVYYPPYLDVYGPSGSQLVQRSRWSYYWGTADLEIAYASGIAHMLVACDDTYGYNCMSSGSGGFAGYLSSYEIGGGASGSAYIDMPGYDIVDGDVAGTSAGEAAVCLVSDTGQAWVLVADPMGAGSVREIAVGDTTPSGIDECAVAVTGAGDLVVAFRDQDELLVGYLDDY